MKITIAGTEYNTDTAAAIAEMEKDVEKTASNYYKETLYRKDNGEYFLHGAGGDWSAYAIQVNGFPRSGERITPLNLAAAIAWAEERINADEFMEIFGKKCLTDGAELKYAIPIAIRESTYATLKRIASMRQMTLSAMVNELALNILAAEESGEYNFIPPEMGMYD